MIDQIRHAKMLHAGIMLLLKSFEMATTSRESWCTWIYSKSNNLGKTLVTITLSL
jgi:hypothetical protein